MAQISTELHPLHATSTTSYGTTSTALHPNKSTTLSSLGTAFFIMAVAVFGVQGLQSYFPVLAQQYLEKDRLMLSPAQSAMIGSVASVPWCIKPLYGEVLPGVLKYCL